MNMKLLFFSSFRLIFFTKIIIIIIFLFQLEIKDEEPLMYNTFMSLSLSTKPYLTIFLFAWNYWPPLYHDLIKYAIDSHSFTHSLISFNFFCDSDRSFIYAPERVCKKGEKEGRGKVHKSIKFDLVKSCKHEQTQYLIWNFVGFLSPR